MRMYSTNSTIITRDDLNCSGPDKMRDWSSSKGQLFLEQSYKVHTYLTPIIIIIGLLGNLVSLRVFTTKAMRQLSASVYLATLSVSDILVLLCYVLFEWLKDGLPKIMNKPDDFHEAVFATNGLCQIRLYLAYSFRLISVGLIILFTVERFIGVTMPFRRKEMCTRTFARRVILLHVWLSFLMCMYKPFISGVVEKRGRKMCIGLPEYQRLNFVLDSIYGLLITAVPFVIIATLNLLILRRLLLTNRRHRRCQFVNQENVIRVEFTYILLIISTGFIALNLPYFVVWCIRHWTKVSIENYDNYEYHLRLRGLYYITRTIFYINYCINFFLYSLTGAFFRNKLRMAFSFLRRRHRLKTMKYPKPSSSPNSPPQTSWL